MRTLIGTLCIGILLTTAGCSSKSPKGEGGFAEHDYSHSPNHPIGLENALYFEQQLSKLHLDSLLVAGANICFPASVQTAKVRQARIARELQGGLDGDAANDLIIQRDQLTRLERRLNYVQMQESCLPFEKGTANNTQNNTEAQSSANSQLLTTLSDKQIQHIMALLNNNNQFVINSAQLNPRYIGQLSEATQLLRAHPQYHLKLTGHSDSKGNQATNIKLSLERASQVERYLLIFGLSPNNIQVNGNGSAEPLFDDDKPQVRLVNRRVSIELINVDNSSKVTLK